MSEVLMQKREEYIARLNERNRVNSDSLVAGGGNNIRNDNSNSLPRNNVTPIRDNLLSKDLGREVAGRRDIPFPLVGRNVSSGAGVGIGGVLGGVGANTNSGFNNEINNVANIVNNANIVSDSGEPIDPFNIVAVSDSGENFGLGNIGLRERIGDQSGVLSNNNNVVQPTTTNQFQFQLQPSPELNVAPAYRIKGYHYSVEDVPPTFLQY
jgi:hypothetical protein